MLDFIKTSDLYHWNSHRHCNNHLMGTLGSFQSFFPLSLSPLLMCRRELGCEQTKQREPALWLERRLVLPPPPPQSPEMREAGRYTEGRGWGEESRPSETVCTQQSIKIGANGHTKWPWGGVTLDPATSLPLGGSFSQPVSSQSPENSSVFGANSCLLV